MIVEVLGQLKDCLKKLETLNMTTEDGKMKWTRALEKGRVVWKITLEEKEDETRKRRRSKKSTKSKRNRP